MNVPSSTFSLTGASTDTSLAPTAGSAVIFALGGTRAGSTSAVPAVRPEQAASAPTDPAAMAALKTVRRSINLSSSITM